MKRPEEIERDEMNLEWIEIEDDDCLQIGDVVLTCAKREDDTFTAPITAVFGNLADGNLGYQVSVTFGEPRCAGFFVETKPTHFAVIRLPDGSCYNPNNRDKEPQNER